MTCPLCKSQRVSCPTERRGAMEIKSGPATCLACGAKEVKQGKHTVWVPALRKED